MKADAPIQALFTPHATPGSAELHNSASLKPSPCACANRCGRACVPAPVLTALCQQPLSHSGAGLCLQL